MRYASILGAMLASVMPLGFMSQGTALLPPVEEAPPLETRRRGGKGHGIPTKKGALGPGYPPADYANDQAVVTAARRATRYIRRQAERPTRGGPPAHIREKIALAQGIARG